MMTVTHVCGHTQGVTYDEYPEEKILRLGKSKAQFVREQTEFLEKNLCPLCFNIEKERNPNCKVR